MKKKLIAMLLCLVSVCALSVGATLAYLTASSGPVENTFTIGNIQLALDETTGNSYQLIPGTTVKKDPKVTVKSGSENCWVFVQVETANGLDQYITYGINDGWTSLGGVAGVYYLQYYQSNADQTYSVLKDDQIAIKDTLTEDKMSAITVAPTFTFTAYAVQSHSVDSALAAWNIVRTETNS
ncbi:MAG: hypothetical protein IJB97_04165 [Clostridia bacterium]|nr:hypothetical protein [Clostridia bacterium]